MGLQLGYGRRRIAFHGNRICPLDPDNFFQQQVSECRNIRERNPVESMRGSMAASLVGKSVTILHIMDNYDSIIDVYNDIVHMHQYIQDPTNKLVI